MTPLVLAGLGLLIWPGRRSTVALLLRPKAGEHRSLRWNPVRSAAVIAGFATVLVIPGPAGVLVGLVAGIALDRGLRRLESGASRRRRRECERDFPVVLDLLAIALRAGLPMSGTCTLVGTALGGPLADALRRVGTLSAIGADTPSAWAHVRDDPLWTDVVRAIERAAESGSALAGSLRRVADEHRVALEQSAEAAARKASVIAMAPLGLCFLPAFVCIGIVPVVIGLLSRAVL